MNSNGIKAIQTVSERMVWPATVHRDLERDCTILAQSNAPTCFGWVIHPGGTLLARPNDIQDLRNCAWICTVVRAPQHYYWFDGVQLHALAFADLIATLEQTLIPASYVDTPEYAEVLRRWLTHQTN